MKTDKPKKEDIKRKVAEILLLLDLASVKVDDIGKHLEGIERDTYGHSQVDRGDIDKGYKVDVKDNKVEILEDDKRHQIHRHGDEEGQLFLFGNLF